MARRTRTWHSAVADGMLWRRPISTAAARVALDVFRRAFVQAVANRSPEAVHVSYQNIRRHLLAQPRLAQQSSLPADFTFKQAMMLAATSTRKDEINTAFIMFADVSSLFASRPTEDHHLAYLQALLCRGWLDQARSRLSDRVFGVVAYNMVMNSYLSIGEYQKALDVFNDALNQAVHPDFDSYKILLQCIAALPTMAIDTTFHSSLKDYLSSSMSREHFVRCFWSVLTPHLTKLDLSTVSAQSSIKSRDTISTTPSSLSESNPITVIEPLIRGLPLHDQRRDQPSASSGDNADESNSHSREWSKKIDTLLELKGIAVAMDSAQALIDQGQPLNVHVASKLVHALCDRIFRSVNETNFQKALAVYRASALSYNMQSTSPIADDQQPILSMFQSLLQTIADMPRSAGAIHLAISLLKDMAELGICFRADIARKLSLRLLQSAPSHDSGYEVYMLFRDQYRSDIDMKTRETILHAFIRMNFDHQTFPPPSLFFLMLNEVTQRNNVVSNRAYTMMLAQIAQGVKLEPGSPSALDAVRQVHKRILLDSSLTPDTILFNALMNAYNHAGSPSEAMVIWDDLFIQGAFDNATLTIVLDTLSHAGSLQRAAQLITKLHRSGYVLDRSNWQSWLELLCRAEKLEEATRLICFDMPRSNPPVIPDEGHIETVLKYAWNVGKRGEVQKRIRRFWPVVWSGLPEHLKA